MYPEQGQFTMRAAAINREFPPQRTPLSARTTTFLSVLLVDLAATTIAVAAATLVYRFVFSGGVPGLVTFYLPVLFVAAFALFGLYPGIAMNPVDETRKLLTASAIAIFALMATVLSGGPNLPVSLISLAGVFTAVCAVIFRDAMRYHLGAATWWGVPAVVIGDAESTAKISANPQKHSALGLRVVGILRHLTPSELLSEREPNEGEAVPTMVGASRIQYALLALSPLADSEANKLIDFCCQRFENVLVIPNDGDIMPFWTGEKDVGGVLGLEMRGSGLHRKQNGLKRVIDLLVAGACGICLLPLLAALYAVVRLSSPGSAFFASTRIGMNGAPFKMWKFRTMVSNAEFVLEEYLERHPSLREEWESSHKLRNDPRITRIGRFLRRTSLDELPQIWNVLRGDMSLTGPRPIVTKEIPRYGETFRLYKTVRPGLTGLWQISGRSDTTYEQRVRYDNYYVRNWSIWLDVYILTKTPQAVCRTRGAY
jgi:Undecaprenyl-phosphate galactose phosphotransferase WbaP